jgi:fatty-acyl-CoA synthase
MVKGIGNWLTKHCELDAEKTAIVFKEKRFTYAQFNKRVNQLVHSLIGIGVRKGDRVNVLLYNSNEMLEVLFACAKLGAIFVPINFRLSVEEIEYIVADSGAHHLVYDERTKPLVDGLRQYKTRITDYIHVGNQPHEQDHTYEELLTASSVKEPNYVVGHDDIVMMMYTSGTTGRPKGAMLSHGNIQWNTINYITFLSLGKEDTTFTVAPLFHVGGLNIFTVPILYIGGTVYIDDQFDPQRTLEVIESEKISTLFLVPAMWQSLSEVVNFNDYDTSSLRLSLSGGAPCPITIIEFFQKRQVKFYEGFGLTESSPLVSLLDSKNATRKNGSVGKPPVHIDVRIVDPNDQDVPVGSVGELLVHGPSVMVGYWNKPDATKETIRNGWLYTGDLAKFDDEGFIYIVDRKKDMIITGGENVYPIEVEQTLYRHPKIKEVAVIGYPDEKWGESVKAIVSLHDEQQHLSLEELREFLDGKLARFKMPKRLEVVPALPRNATGKILKTLLRKQEQKLEMKQ